MRNFKNILTMVVGSLSIIFYTQIASAETASEDATVTERAATISDGVNHSGESRMFLLCDAGASNLQNCIIYMQVVAGVNGVISDTSDSKIALSGSGANITGTVYGSAGTTITTTGFTATKPTGTLAALPGDTNPSSAMTVGAGTISDPLAGEDNNASMTSLDALGGDLCRVFDAADSADLHYTSTGTGTYSAATGTIETLLAASNTNSAIFVLQGYAHAALIDRDSNFGYAETFSVPYTITVTSNTAGAAVTC